MKHVSHRAMIAGAIEFKEGDDPVALVQKAIDDLTKQVDERIKAVEAKGGNSDTDETVKKLQQRIEELETKANRPGGDKQPPSEQAKLERKAFGAYLRLGNQTPIDEIKVLTVSNDPQAGYLAPAEMSTEMLRDLVEISPIRSVASVRSTTAPSVKYPKRTSITNAQWEGELEDEQESNITFAQVEVPISKLMTYVDISNELLADSGGTAEAEVRQAFAEDFGQKEAVAFLMGSGVKQPEGLLVNGEIEPVINGSTTAISTDKLIDLLYSLPATYRNAPNARWAMNGTTLAAIRKLKNGTTGEYIWQPALVAGQPETILGKPVLEMVDMPDIGDGNCPIIYGDFQGYRIVDRLALSVLSDPYTQATRGVTRLHATRRTGGRVIQPARFRKLETSAS